jgi:hypothetical protein
MNKKILMKIRLRPDGSWEHVYDDGSTDQEFYELNAHSLAALQKNRETLYDMANDYLELAVEASDCRDAKEVLSRFVLQK